MINFRYHIVSLAAVLFALAAGVVLGAGLLHQEDADETGSSRNVDISPQLVGFDAGFASITADDLLRGGLKDRTVLVVSLPNSRESEVNNITENLRVAGASVTGQIRLTSTMLSPAKKQFVEGVAAQSNPDSSRAEGTYETVGSALAKAYVDPKASTVSQEAATIRAAFVEGKLVENIKEPSAKAQLVVLVAGAPRANEDGQGEIVSIIASEFDRGSRGVVVAGPIASGEDGVVSQVRASDASSSVSTVDVTDLATGRITTVLALVRESQGKGGSWGTTRSADGPVPN